MRSKRTITWCLLWIACLYFSIFQHMNSEEVLIKEGDMKYWDSRRTISYIRSSSSGNLGEQLSVTDRILAACGTGIEVNDWFLTKHVNLNRTYELSIAQIFVEVDSELTKCFAGGKDPVECHSYYFGIYIYDGEYRMNVSDSSSYFKPVYNLTNKTTSDNAPLRNNQIFSFNSQNYSQGVTFAIRSRGACGEIFRMKMYYYVCEETFFKGIKLERTKSASPAKGVRSVIAKCSENSIPSTNDTVFNAYCYANGSWSLPKVNNSGCLCVKGYTPNTNGSCSSCSNETYKQIISNDNCTECPRNGTVSNMNRTSCLCKHGYYKRSHDSELSPCYVLPRIVEQPKTNLIPYVVNLSWIAPENNLNEIILYNVTCFTCNEAICKISCRNEAYDPRSNNLRQTGVIVSNLTAGESYVFKVYVGIKDAVPEGDWNYIETSRVQVIGPSDKSPESKEDDDDDLLKYIIIGAIAAMLLLLIILLIICVRKRKKNGIKKSRHVYDNRGVELPDVGRRLYVDPTNYDDAEEAVQEFTSEIDCNMVFLERMIGGGEFGDVYQGELTTKDKKKIPIAAKTLKHDANAKSARDFLLEASIMGQFDNPNIVRMEGVVTKSIPRMIILEFMSNGSLDRYLKNNDNLLTNLQLIGMARGVSAGMTYLSEIHFVHRDLAARNILVNENMLCKIADFGLSRELEEKETSRGEYMTQGGKIPIRWTAPEAIKYRKFSTASDVWSYGIVLWEIMTYSERPYWEWDNIKVVKEVEAGFRLPSPPDCPKGVHDLMLECWKVEKNERPKFARITIILDKWIRSPETMNDDIGFLSPIGEWLESIKMGSYETNFIEAGYKCKTDIVELTDEDLITIGITLIGHRNKIMKNIKILKDEDNESRQSMNV